jgi:hypothetical protein
MELSRNRKFQSRCPEGVPVLVVQDYWASRKRRKNEVAQFFEPIFTLKTASWQEKHLANAAETAATTATRPHGSSTHHSQLLRLM